MTIQTPTAASFAGLSATDLQDKGAALSRAGVHGLRFSVAGVLGWIGTMKFTAYEAGAIQGLVQSSPLVSWLYNLFSVQATSNLIGTTEIATAALLVAGVKFPKIGLIGALAAAFTFLVTFSFLFTAPGWEASLGGFPALSVVPGQFLLKDAVLFAAALFLAGDAASRIAKGA